MGGRLSQAGSLLCCENSLGGHGVHWTWCSEGSMTTGTSVGRQWAQHCEGCTVSRRLANPPPPPPLRFLHFRGTRIGGIQTWSSGSSGTLGLLDESPWHSGTAPQNGTTAAQPLAATTHMHTQGPSARHHLPGWAPVPTCFPPNTTGWSQPWPRTRCSIVVTAGGGRRQDEDRVCVHAMVGQRVLLGQRLGRVRGAVLPHEHRHQAAAVVVWKPG